MALSLKIEDVVAEISDQTENCTGFMNKKTGKFHMITDEDIQAAESDEPRENFPPWQHESIAFAKSYLETDDYLGLPSKFDIDEYNIMKRFSRSVEDDQKREDLCDCIHGKGAFRNFRDKIIEFGIEADWYRYLDDALRQIAIDWCDENGIAYRD